MAFSLPTGELHRESELHAPCYIEAHIDLGQALQLLQAEADAENRGPTSVQMSVGVLKQAGLLLAPLAASCGGEDLARSAKGVPRAVDTLIAIGSADLAMGRLYEGHLNALHLIELHGTQGQVERGAGICRDGKILGVWGADREKVTLIDGVLSGSKMFCSGLGSVALAVVPVTENGAQQLLLLETTDPNRQDPSLWRMQGMRATHSGGYDFHGVPVGPEDRLGPPDIYTTEPHFLGGVWRIAAAELGGVFGLLEAARTMLEGRNRLEDPAHLGRLGDVLMSAHAARALTISAGEFAQGSSGAAHPKRAAQLSVMARLTAERCAEEALTKVAKSVGLAGHITGELVERRLRDLSTFMRQMAPDALHERMAQSLLGRRERLADAFHP